jgi:hypothetical protein
MSIIGKFHLLDSGSAACGVLSWEVGSLGKAHFTTSSGSQKARNRTWVHVILNSFTKCLRRGIKKLQVTSLQLRQTGNIPTHKGILREERAQQRLLSDFYMDQSPPNPLCMLMKGNWGESLSYLHSGGWDMSMCVSCLGGQACLGLHEELSREMNHLLKTIDIH